MRMTLKKMAQELGISISTVSKALNNHSEISQNTRDLVQAFARQHNYRPNHMALRLKSKKTKTIGVVVPEIVHEFFSKVIRGIEAVADAEGYNVLISVSNESYEKEVLVLELYAEGIIDGIILGLSGETLEKQDFEHLTEVQAREIPLVLFDRYAPGLGVDCVRIDDYKSSIMATEHLIEAGCRHLAVITTPPFMIVGEQRYQGFCAALEKHQLPLHQQAIVRTFATRKPEDIQQLEVQLKKLFEEDPAVDGILAVNEYFGAAAINVLRSIGRSVPEEVKVITFSDGILSKNTFPSMSTVSQHGELMGRTTAQMILERMQKPARVPHEQIIQTELILRDSTA
ncbi:MAG: LacI family DNA-binding transcriptional regulator [Flavobacteriaceae bacterium]